MNLAAFIAANETSLDRGLKHSTFKPAQPKRFHWAQSILRVTNIDFPDEERVGPGCILAACFARGGKQLIGAAYPGALVSEPRVCTWYTRHMAHYELM